MRQRRQQQRTSLQRSEKWLLWPLVSWLSLYAAACEEALLLELGWSTGNLTLRGLGLDSRNLGRNRNLKRNRLGKVFLVPVRVQAWVSGTLLVGAGEGMEQAEDG